jgi:protoporphyrinogen oxidase
LPTNRDDPRLGHVAWQIGVNVDVVVVGGGPCGLAAALGAARTGRSVLLVEQADATGGLAASFTVAGQRVDHGSHRLHPSAPPRVRALLDELLGDDLQVRTRDGRLHLAGRWVEFPFRAGDLVRRVPPSVGARIAGDLATGPLRRGGADSYAGYVRAGLGPTALEHFHGPMATKLWGRPPEELSAELARRRIAVNGGGSVLRRVARTSRRGGRTFLYPRLGYGEVVDRLAEAATAAGTTLVTRTAVAELTPGRTVGVALTDGRAVTAGRVLWTAGPDALAAAAQVDPGAPIVHRGLVLAYLAVPEGRYSAVDAHYVPDLDVPFTRLSEPKNYRDGPDPPEVTVLCAELPATVGDATWALSINDLLAVVLDGMARLGLRRPDVVEAAVRRVARVYPVLAAGDTQRDDALTAVGALDGVAVLGRQGRHVADNLHHVLDMAGSAVDCLTDDGWDEMRWTAEQARFESFVVDD